MHLMVNAIRRGKELWRQTLQSTKALINPPKPTYPKYHQLVLPKDVTIYTFENKNNIRFLAVAGATAGLVIVNMSYVLYKSCPAFFKWIPAEEISLKKGQRTPRAKWWFRASFSFFMLLVAGGLVGGICGYSGRCVQSITLLKSSGEVLLTTYTPLGTAYKTIVPIRHVSALEPLQGEYKAGYLPLKVKDHSFNFLVNRTGDFPRPTLFERTVGMSRNFGIEKKPGAFEALMSQFQR